MYKNNYQIFSVRNIKLLAVLVFICMAAGVLLPEKAQAYSAAEIEARVPDARNHIVNNMEAPCTESLRIQNTGPGTSNSEQRAKVNNSNPYRDLPWISPSGSPTQLSTTVPYGTTSVPLQLNKMLFVCAIIVVSNYGSSYITDPDSIVNYGNFSQDRSPNIPSDCSIPQCINGASLWNVNSSINSTAVVEGGGSVSNPGGYLSTPRDTDSRYWFSAPHGLTYDAGGPMTSSRKIKIRVNMTNIRTYHNYPSSGGTSQCTAPGNTNLTLGTSPAAATNFAACSSYDVDFEFNIIVPASSNFDSVGVGCDLNNFITGWAFDPDKTDGNIYNRNPPGGLNNTTGSISVHVYVDGEAGTSPYPPSDRVANIYRGDVNSAFGITGNHGFKFAFDDLNSEQKSALATPGPHTIYIYKIGVDGSGNPDDDNPQINGSPKTFDSSSCLSTGIFECSNVVTDPGTVEVGVPFKLRARISMKNGLGAYTYNATLNVPPPPSNPSATTGPATAFKSSGSVDNVNPDSTALFEPLTVTERGKYTGTISVTFSPGSKTINCPFTTGGSSGDCVNNCRPIQAVTKPYFNLRQGDVSAGLSSATCPGWSGTSTGKLKSWNTVIGGVNKGAGTNLATYALDIIDEVASGQSPSGSSPPKGLSFANTTTFGGQFGGGLSCPTDYFSKGSLVSLNSGNSVTVSNSMSDNEKYGTGSTQVTITGGTIPIGRRIALYIDGDAYISNSGPKRIKFAGSGAWPINQIPSFYLIVKGNIFIHPDVDELDGVYVAQPDSLGNKGRIYTCAPSAFNIPSKAELNGVCEKKLTVRGAFIAKELKLYRTLGSLSTTGPAEEFIYTTATWLAAPSTIRSNGYNSITSLPPIL